MSLFKGNLHLTTVDDVRRLASLLAGCPEVTRFDSGDHKEAWALADSFGELERSMRAFLDVQLPSLTNGNLSPKEINGALLDIGEKFRRILYHMLEQQKFYRYLVPEQMFHSDEEPDEAEGANPSGQDR